MAKATELFVAALTWCSKISRPFSAASGPTLPLGNSGKSQALCSGSTDTPVSHREPRWSFPASGGIHQGSAAISGFVCSVDSLITKNSQQDKASGPNGTADNFVVFLEPGIVPLSINTVDIGYPLSLPGSVSMATRSDGVLQY